MVKYFIMTFGLVSGLALGAGSVLADPLLTSGDKVATAFCADMTLVSCTR